jgi:hypothetical protein
MQYRSKAPQPAKPHHPLLSRPTQPHPPEKQPKAAPRAVKATAARETRFPPVRNRGEKPKQPAGDGAAPYRKPFQRFSLLSLSDPDLALYRVRFYKYLYNTTISLWLQC